jgi:Ca2+-binding RTX toxin-like protein
MPTKPDWTTEQAAQNLLRWYNSINLWGHTLGQAMTVKYHFKTEVKNTDTLDGQPVTNFQPFNAAQKQATTRALDAWMDVANLVFEETAEAQDPAQDNRKRIDFGNAKLFGVGQTFSRTDQMPTTVWIDYAIPQRARLDWGESGLQTLLHEIGHALGLHHPGDYDATHGRPLTYTNDATYAQDTKQYTDMSYFAVEWTGATHGEVCSPTPMLHDIAAVQKIFGANMAARAGNTWYGFNTHKGDNKNEALDFSINKTPVVCIWDGRGLDTLDLSGFDDNSLIDLNEEAFSDANGLTKNISIAKGAQIENAVGGKGNDVLLANALQNTLDGGAGIDTADYGGLNPLGLAQGIVANLATGQVTKTLAGTLANVGARAQYIRIYHTDANPILSLTELKVFVGGVNIALGLDTRIGADSGEVTGAHHNSQALTDGGHGGENYDGQGAGGNIAWVLAYGEKPYFELNLGSEQFIDSVLVQGRGPGGYNYSIESQQLRLYFVPTAQHWLADTFASKASKPAWDARIPNGSSLQGIAAVDIPVVEVQPANPGKIIRTDTLKRFENLSGSLWADDITGDSKDNVLKGRDGDDTIRGGKGQDTVVGGNGDDLILQDDEDWSHLPKSLNTYGGDTLYGSFDTGPTGIDTGIDTVDYSRVTKSDGIKVYLNASQYGAAVAVRTYETYSIWNWLTSGLLRKVSYIREWLTDIEYVTGTMHADELEGDTKDNVLRGGDGNDILVGGYGNDTLQGGAGKDVIEDDGLGADSFVFLKGDGHDVIRAYSHDTINVTSKNTLQLGAGLGLDKLLLRRAGSDLVFSWLYNHNDSVTLEDYFLNTNREYLIGSVRFAEKWATDTTFVGDPWTIAISALMEAWFTGGDAVIGHGHTAQTLSGDAGNNQLQGGDGEDTLQGGAGSDTLCGGHGDDCYYFNLGDGRDTITEASGHDRVMFGPGITAEQISLSHTGDLVTISFANSPGDSLSFMARAGAYGWPVEELEFADGSAVVLGANPTVSLQEDSSYTVSAADLGLAVEGAGAMADWRAILTDLPHAGGLTFNGAAAAAGTVISAADLAAGRLVFRPAVNDNGDCCARLGFSLQDLSDPTSRLLPGSLTFNVTPVNDGPSGSVSLWRGDTALTAATVLQPGDLVWADNSLADVDGLQAPRYQWESSPDGATWSEIAGAGADSLSVTHALGGQRLRAVARYTDDHGTAERVASAATAAVSPPNLITGTAGPDTLAGSERADWVRGLAGNDWLTASAGNDLFDGGDGVDGMDYSRSYTAGGIVADLAAGHADKTLAGTSVAVGATGRYIRIRHTAASATPWLSLAEMKVLSGGVNVAAGKLSTVGADGGSFESAHNNPWALGDGKMGENYNWLMAGGNMAWVRGLSGKGFIELDLGSEQAIDLIALWGRADPAYLAESWNLELEVLSAAHIRVTTVNVAKVQWEAVDAASQDTLVNVEHIEGSLFDDFLKGDAAANWLRGEAGDDMLDGGDGADTLEGGSGHDVLAGGAGADTVNGGAGDDVIVGEVGRVNETLDGGAGIDRLDYSATDLRGLTSKGILVDLAAGTVTKTLEGTSFNVGVRGQYIRIYHTDANTQILNLTGLKVFADGVDVAAGKRAQAGADSNKIAVNNYHNELALTDDGRGGYWNNQSTPTTSNLAWASGNRPYIEVDLGSVRAIDMIVLHGRLDYLWASQDVLVCVSETAFPVSATAYASIVNDPAATKIKVAVVDAAASTSFTDTVKDFESIRTTALADSIRGDAGNNMLDGGEGGDTMAGGAGDDCYVVDVVSYVEGCASDVVIEAYNQGIDTVLSSVSYSLRANQEKLILTGEAATEGYGNELDNTLVGNAAANTLCGGAGKDSLEGGAGSDYLAGGTGDDTYIADGNDQVIELAGEGTDTVLSSSSFALWSNLDNLTLTGTAAIDGWGNDQANWIFGNTANNFLHGGAGIDALLGRMGNDHLVGGTDSDYMAGEAGSDTYLFSLGDGTDRIVNENNQASGDRDVWRLESPGVDVRQVWFRKIWDDAGIESLELSLNGTSDKVTFWGWYSESRHVEELQVGGKKLLDANVDQLVNAMAGFEPPGAGSFMVPPSYRAVIDQVIAANWVIA